MEQEEENTNKELIYSNFWCIDPKGKINIHHEGLIEFFRGQGFCWLNINDSKQLVLMQGNIVSEIDITDIVNCTYEFIWSDLVPDLLGNGAKKKDLLNLFVRGIYNYIHNAKLRLLPIIKKNQHRDTETTSYFYCRENVVKITANAISISSYSSLDGYVWKDQIKPLSFSLLDTAESTGDFETFAYHICDKNEVKNKSFSNYLAFETKQTPNICVKNYVRCSQG